MIALPDRPTGADLVAAIEAVADVLGVTPIELAAPLSRYPANWLKQTREAKCPRAETIERVRALLAGKPVPAQPPNNFQARAGVQTTRVQSTRARAIREEAAEEARQRADRLRQAQTLSGTVFIDAEQTLRERRLANINDPAAIGARGTLAEDLAARIDRDQAARRAARERWLDVEQQRYGLARRGRLPDDMPA